MRNKMDMMGKVTLIGAGPGDPELITLKGIKAIKDADVVVYDYLATEELLDLVRADAELIYVGKRGGHHTKTQEEINQILVDKAREGRSVARLKGGDPFVFGRGGEEAEVLSKAGISFEIVPGITSAVAVPAYAGIPVTHRRFNSSFTILTGHEDPHKEKSHHKWERIAAGETLIFLMGMKNLSSICNHLIKSGKDAKTPVAVIRWGTTPRQQTVVGRLDNILEEVKRAGLSAPAIIVVGDVVSLRENLIWFEKRPLFGKRILVTRARKQASRFIESLRELGADPISLPTIEVVPPPSFELLDNALREVQLFDWIIFTSVNGVDAFFSRMKKLKMDIRSLSGISLSAIGPQTANSIEKLGLFTEVVPSDYRAEGLIEELSKREINGSNIMIPRALEARPILVEGLLELGAKVKEIPVYKTVCPENSKEKLKGIMEDRIDLITFTASSTVKNLYALSDKSGLIERLREVPVACIGPITANTAKELGFNVIIQPEEYTIPALTNAIKDYFSSQAQIS